ncbi:hypothetical protein [Natrinema longum]|uniref:Uncharacterized protein n=1 Tax=Natrinema longum TaxID=370324 RepID=A0A8A2U7P7_9EURY|nr:hypothetical protein [Natrinema longum]MBZ6494402.1 hypothetical protein [Natrinema longum]QSW84275.1 hypothetical protein J0X27_12545 [Natrinema longum]
MSTESISDRREHIRSVSVTALSALLGVGAALASATWVGVSEAAAQDTQALAFVFGAIVVQYILINASGIYGEDEFGTKHYLFVAFMTFSLWFVTWGILLTSEVSG